MGDSENNPKMGNFIAKYGDPIIVVRPGIEGERRLVEDHLSPRWWQAAAPLVATTKAHLIVANEEIVGSTGVARMRCRESFEMSRRESLSTVQFGERLVGDANGMWAFAADLRLDPRLPRLLGDRGYERLIRRAGPVFASLYVERLSLQGYFAAVSLSGRPRFAPALSAWAYIQQVDAGAIDEPLLVSHLRYGARPVAVVEDDLSCAAIVRWKCS